MELYLQQNVRVIILIINVDIDNRSLKIINNTKTEGVYMLQRSIEEDLDTGNQ